MSINNSIPYLENNKTKREKSYFVKLNYMHGFLTSIYITLLIHVFSYHSNNPNRCIIGRERRS